MISVSFAIGSGIFTGMAIYNILVQNGPYNAAFAAGTAVMMGLVSIIIAVKR